MSLFEKSVEINKEEKTITITVSCEKRKHAIDQKAVFKESLETLIPEELRNKVNLISKPNKPVSNLEFIDHANVGIWVYSFNNDEEKVPARRTRQRKTRNSTTKKKV